MSSLPLRYQILLMVLDKLVIGAIVAVIVFWAQKRLEGFKAQQSLEGEVAKRRVDNIAKGWVALNAWDLAVNDLICEFARIFREENPELGKEAGLDDLGQPDLNKLADWLANMHDEEALERIKAHCETDLEDWLNRSVSNSNNARVIMQENRFWFGKELYDHCKKFHAILHGICVAFGERNFQTLPTQLRKLEFARRDVLMTLQDVRLLPKARPSASN